MPRIAFVGFTWTTVLFASSLSLSDEPQAKSSDRSPRTELIPDPRWEPTPGQFVTVPGEPTPAARTLTAWDAYDASRKANDVVGIDRLYDSGGLVRLSKGTKILVVRDHAPPRMGNGSQSAGAFASSLVHAQPAIRSDGFPVEVRILDGPHEEKLAFVSRKDIAKLVERRVIPVLNPGDKATVARPDSVIAKDYNDLYGYKFAQIDGDRARIMQLLRSGVLAKLNDGVKVVVLGTEGEFARVKVHSGSKLAGNTGYVPAGDLIPPE